MTCIHIIVFLRAGPKDIDDNHIYPAEALLLHGTHGRHGGEEVVKLLQKGSAYYAPASSACLMVEAILRNQSRLLPAATYLKGEYGLHDIFLGVPCRLGCRGVEQILEVHLTETEKQALAASADSVRQNLKLALDGL